MEKGNDELILRVDAGGRIGMGHLMRCLAVAQAWRNHGRKATFLTSGQGNESIAAMLSECNIGILDIKDSQPDPEDWVDNWEIKPNSGSWVILDGYHFNSSLQRRIRNAGFKLLVIDDYAHLDDYEADILLNQNINADNLPYRCDTETKKLMGPTYALLREEFLFWKDQVREIRDRATNILVLMGGSDPDDVTLMVVDALKRLKISDIDVKIVVGPFYRNRASLSKSISASPFSVEILHNVKNMPELMAWADISVSAAGSTSWELAFMGLPSLIMVLAENQHKIAQELHQSGIAVNMGWFHQITPYDVSNELSVLINSRIRREYMSHNGRALVDGAGTERVINKMLTYSMA